MSNSENEIFEFLSVADEEELGEVEYNNRLKLYKSLPHEVAVQIQSAFESGSLSSKDFNAKSLEILNTMSSSEVTTALEELKKQNPEDKNDFLSSFVKDNKKHSNAKVTFSEAEYIEYSCNSQSPDEDKIKALLERTGYSLEITSGQRKYGGPPPNCTDHHPPNGHEIYCGKIPRDMYEDELVPLFEKYGKLWDIRLMMDPVQGRNRGFCFVTYCNMEAANEAVKNLKNFEIKPGYHLKVNISDPNCRLFIGNIPKTRSKEDILEELKKHIDGIIDVIVYGSPDDTKIKNRGFAFVDFDSHKSASAARRRIMIGGLVIWGLQVICDWAEPLDLDPSEEVMAKVKVLYVRNLKSEVTEQELHEMFEKFGSIERVKKVKSYGFVHFNSRESAVEAMKQMHGTKVSDVEIDVSLAKPLLKNKNKDNMKRNGYSFKHNSYNGLEPPPSLWNGSFVGRPNNYNRGKSSRNYSNYYGANNYYYDYPSSSMDCYNNWYDCYGYYQDAYNYFYDKPRGNGPSYRRRGLMQLLNEYPLYTQMYNNRSYNNTNHKRGSYKKKNKNNNKNVVPCNA